MVDVVVALNVVVGTSSVEVTVLVTNMEEAVLKLVMIIDVVVVGTVVLTVVVG